VEGTKRTREGGVRNHGVPHNQMALLWASFRGLPFVPDCVWVDIRHPERSVGKRFCCRGRSILRGQQSAGPFWGAPLLRIVCFRFAVMTLLPVCLGMLSLKGPSKSSPWLLSKPHAGEGSGVPAP
jgi:hypothetical protein